jgi:hypothetical protein
VLFHFGCDNRETVGVQLQAIDGCPNVEVAIRQVALDEMNQRIDQALAQAMTRGYRPCRYHGEADDSPMAAAGSPSAPQYNSGAADPADQTTPAGGEQGAKQASTTNNQVAGVDEADFIKNDNKTIFVLAGDRLQVIDAWPAEEAKIIGELKIEGTPKKVFVYQNRALVYSSLTATEFAGDEGSAPQASSKSATSSRECTYGYRCSFTGDGQPTKISLIDISDLTAPKLVREIKLSGSFVNARRVGAAVHTVFSSSSVPFKGLSYSVPSSSCATTWNVFETIQAFEALRQKNAQIIAETTLSDYFPNARDTRYVDGQAQTTQALLSSCEGFYKSTISDGSQFTTLLSLEIDRDSDVSSSTIVSLPGAVYASAEALYLAVPHQRTNGRAWFEEMQGRDEASTVHKFAFAKTGAAARYVASGVVKGRVLNQFSMDEYEGNLRLATTNGRVPSSDVHSTLSVLVQAGSELKARGLVDNIAPHEDIRSVRFSGDRGYVVTFKKTDPLFVFDLSQAAAPKIMAELKIPGFSTYMQMMDDRHLLTIGYDANAQGSAAWRTGEMVPIGDGRDPPPPLCAPNEVSGTRGSSSEARTNHLAFNYFASKNVLALPMTICEGSAGGGNYGKDMTFSGLMVYDVTAAAGFKLRGKVDHPLGPDATCSNWWTDARSDVKRSIVLDDYVFSVSHDLIKVNHLDSLGSDLVSISLANQSNP